MNPQEAIDYIHGTLKFGSKLGLSNITELLRRCGNPQLQYKCIHIAGTNGKGSTAAMLYSILTQAGLRVGLYTSPYLERFTERIRANTSHTFNEEIDGESLAEIVTELKGHVDAMVSEGFNHPTEFEITTALGFVWFARQHLDYCVVEVGLGGRFDATNVITPLVSVITSISKDHMAILGDTLREIAFEKSGIIKPGVPVVSYPQVTEVADEIARNAAERGCVLHCVRREDVTGDCRCFTYDDGTRRLEGLHLSLVGEYQLRNASVAIRTALLLSELGVPVTEAAIRNGLSHSVWPGRFECFTRDPYIILDGAHNEDGAAALRRVMDTELAGKSIILVIGILRDKDYDKVINTICPTCSRIIAITADSPRALPYDELCETIKYYGYWAEGYADVTCAIDYAIELYRDTSNSVILFAGSLYMIGDVRRRLGEMGIGGTGVARPGTGRTPCGVPGTGNSGLLV